MLCNAKLFQLFFYVTVYLFQRFVGKVVCVIHETSESDEQSNIAIVTNMIYYQILKRPIVCLAENGKMKADMSTPTGFADEKQKWIQ